MSTRFKESDKKRLVRRKKMSDEDNDLQDTMKRFLSEYLQASNIRIDQPVRLKKSKRKPQVAQLSDKIYQPDGRTITVRELYEQMSANNWPGDDESNEVVADAVNAPSNQ